MIPHDLLRHAIAQEHARLRAAVPPDRQAAVLALIHAQDRLPHAPCIQPPPDLVTGQRLHNPGGNLAIQLCLESPRASGAAPHLEAWADPFLLACGRLATAELVLAHHEAGVMRLAEDTDATIHAWIASKRAPATWRERADIDWWAASLARQHEPELRTLRPNGSNQPLDDAQYGRLATIHLETMAYQLGYRPDADLGGITVQTYRAVLAHLIARALHNHDRGQPTTPHDESALITDVASALALDPGTVSHALSAFTLDQDNAAYHAAVPGVAAAPLVRISPDRLLPSLHGLTTQPLLFLTRELRRRDPEAYHNTAQGREAVFRRDLYRLFPDKRFVTSSARLKLRRADGDLRTDIDALVFDRKTGTLALFELKSQDPFARSPAELARQRDNVLYANRQISGILAWLKHHGPDEILARVDARAAKTFRVHRVYPVVLGRYLAHFPDGPEPDRRAAWATWPQLLRALDGQPVPSTAANPLASLVARLTTDTPLTRSPATALPQTIPLGPVRLVVHPSYAAFQAYAGG